MDFVNFLVKSMRQAPFIDAGERAALDSGGSSGGGGGNLGGMDLGGEEATPEMLAQFGISAEDFNSVKQEFPAKNQKTPQTKPAHKKEAQKGPAKKGQIGDDRKLSTEEMLKALNGEEDIPQTEDEAEEIPGEDEDVDDSLPEDEPEEGEEEEEFDEAAKKADRMRFKDYTEKTQALAKERKAFDTWKNEVEREVHQTYQDIQKNYKEMDEKISTLDMWDHAVDIIKEDQPELYDALMDAFNGVRKQYRNPVVSREIQNLKRELAELKGQGREGQDRQRQQSDAQIRDSFNQELAQTKTSLGPKLQKLGIKIDWEAVTENWIDSGAKTVEKALYNVYGDQIAKRYESRDRTSKIQRRVEIGKTPSAKRGTRAPSKGSEEINVSKRGWNDLVGDILSGRLSA